MGTLRGQVGPFMLGWACRAGTRNFSFALGALVGPVQNISFPRRTLVQCLCPHRLASWAGSHAGSPVSYCVSLGIPFVYQIFAVSVYSKHDAETLLT
jgi:hypothetical protein